MPRKRWNRGEIAHNYVCSRRETRSGRTVAAQPSAATRQASRSALSRPADGGRDTERPGPRHVRNQASSFSTQRSREKAQRTRTRRILALRAESDRRLREAPYCPSLRPLCLPPCFSVLKNLLACLGTAATTHYRRVPTGERNDVRISQGTALGAILAEAPGEPVRYRHPWKFAARRGDAQGWFSTGRSAGLGEKSHTRRDELFLSRNGQDLERADLRGAPQHPVDRRTGGLQCRDLTAAV